MMANVRRLWNGGIESIQHYLTLLVRRGASLGLEIYPTTTAVWIMMEP